MDTYTLDDEGSDFLANAYSGGILPTGTDETCYPTYYSTKKHKVMRDKLVGVETTNDDGLHPIFQKGSTTRMQSQTSKRKPKPDGGYYDSENDDYIVTNPTLSNNGIKLGDYVTVKYKNIIIQHVRVADSGPTAGYKQGTLEISVHLYQKFKPLKRVFISIINFFTGKPYQNPKWQHPDPLDLDVQKEDD